jgi:hypothetical protein
MNCACLPASGLQPAASYQCYFSLAAWHADPQMDIATCFLSRTAQHNAFYKPNIVITRDFSGGSSTSFESLIIFL